MRGFAVVELPVGLVIVDCAVHVAADGAAWAALPARPLLGADGRPLLGKGGKVRWASVLRWADRDRAARFSEAVIALVRLRDPDALDEDGR